MFFTTVFCFLVFLLSPLSPCTLGVFLKFFFCITIGSLAIAIQYFTSWRTIWTWWLKRKKLHSLLRFYSCHTIYFSISELLQVHILYRACPLTIAEPVFQPAILCFPKIHISPTLWSLFQSILFSLLCWKLQFSLWIATTTLMLWFRL